MSAIDLGGDDGYNVSIAVKRTTKTYCDIAISVTVRISILKIVLCALNEILQDEALVWGVCVSYIAHDATLAHDKSGKVLLYNLYVHQIIFFRLANAIWTSANV